MVIVSNVRGKYKFSPLCEYRMSSRERFGTPRRIERQPEMAKTDAPAAAIFAVLP